jgi:CCR4-NOT complex subunit CAF16
MVAAESQAEVQEAAVAVNGLTYAYPGHSPILRDIAFDLPAGSRCLLIGGNGAGVIQCAY